jgi:3-hydroxyisobutyrate dehydrogenase-like beta-hydroxyacid dehydrogenase
MQGIQSLEEPHDSRQWHSMTIRSLIGFGEAGQAFAVAPDWRAYDILPERTRAATLPEALDGAGLILCVVTADQALGAAQNAASCIAKDALYCDMNSVAPQTKKAAAALIAAAGGRYVDVAVMSPVHPARQATPLLLSGPHAQAGETALNIAGFTNMRVVSGEIGHASTIKMLRSVMIKGIEALTAEMMLAARAAGVEADVLASLGDDWDQRAPYNLERMTTHGKRRAAEMEEVVKTLISLNIDPVMTRGTIRRQREMAA